MSTDTSNVVFTKAIDIAENVDIQKLIDVQTEIFGNVALANANASALSPFNNTTAQTLTEAHVVWNVGSSSASESVAATDPFTTHLHIA